MPLMTHSADTTFLNIETAAHGGAFGKNPIPEPTEAQRAAGNYKMGRVSLYGLPIAIEQPRGTYRTGIDPKTGKRWTSRMAAHYGYINGTKGNDGDAIDCFIGFYPQSESAYVINQNIDDHFDETKIMLAFPDEETAKRAYMDSYERGWNGLGSIVSLSISQLKRWLKHGDMNRPLINEDLSPEGLEAMTRKVQWDKHALPYDQTLDQVLYEIRISDSGDNLLLDSVTINDILDDSDGILAFDALVTPYAKLERKMEVLQGIMERTGQSVKPISMQITEPFKQNGVANVAVVYELSDGQTVSIYLHNPDVTPQKMAPADEIISWKWLLNKKDITIVVAPERGQDLNVREVARRIMKLAEKNSPAFTRANVKRSERMQAIQSLKDEIVVLEGELKSVQNELEIAKVAAEDRKPVQQPEADNTEQTGEQSLETYYDKNGRPFKTKSAAEDFRIRNNLDVTHTVSPITKIIENKYVDGYMVRPRNIKAKDTETDQSDGQNAMNETDLIHSLPDDYAKIMSDSDLQLKYQDVLDSIFQERLASVRNALSNLGWAASERGNNFTKMGFMAMFNYDQAGSGNNIIGYEIVINKKRFVDDLTKTPEQFAAEIDTAVPVDSASDATQQGNDAESEDMKAAKAFLQSVIDGGKDAENLMTLLDEIDEAANALINAGLGEQYDALIGSAAEKWAELDQQTNG